MSYGSENDGSVGNAQWRRAWRRESPGPSHYKQRTNTVTVGHSVATGLSRWTFRCLGAHLLRSPSNVKSGIGSPAAPIAGRGQTMPVASRSSLSPKSTSRQQTSSRRRVALSHSQLAFRCGCLSFSLAGKIKNPAHFPVSRVLKASSPFRYLLTSSRSKLVLGSCPRYAIDGPRLNAQPRLDRL